MTYARSAFFCSFCGKSGGEFEPYEMCSGSFLGQADHPSLVRPILMDLRENGEFMSGNGEAPTDRLAKARARYA